MMRSATFLAAILAVPTVLAAPIIDLQAAASQVPSAFASTSSQTSNSTVSSAAASTSRRYSTVIVFGASYQDNGHSRSSQYSSSLTSYPYVGGRHSNGPVMVEQLSSLLGASNFYDYAYSGATVDNNLMGAGVPDTKSQISTFMSAASSLTYGSDRRLYVYWTGINSILGIWSGVRYNNDLSSGLSSVTANVNALQTQINSLVGFSSGGVRNDLLLLPIPPVETLPIATQSASAKELNLLSRLSSAYNAGIAQIVANAQASVSGTTQRIYTYDVESFWRGVISSPSRYSLSDVSSPCLGYSACGNPASYLYWDAVHPTTTFDGTVARQIYSSMNVAS